MIYIINLLMGILLSLFVISIKYLFYNQITSINDIAKYTDTPLLGVIPRYSNGIPSSQLVIDKIPKSVIAEAFRAIRTNLQFINNDPGSKVIAISSTISGEGKTFVAINLASVISLSDKKCIIIDLDMRMPSIHKGFNVENRRGMSTLLSGKDSLDDCINKDPHSKLHFITAGPVPPNPSELIISEKMERLLNQLKSRYDFIIIDNPPVGIVTDGMRSIQMADYPIYIFKANYSKRIFIENLERLINDNNIKKLSFVLNSVEPMDSRYRYKNVYGYHPRFDQRYVYGYGYVEGYYDEQVLQKKKSSLIRKIFRIFK